MKKITLELVIATMTLVILHTPLQQPKILALAHHNHV
jgi:hypothetical protein